MPDSTTINLHRLTAQELVDLVNFTFLGEVLTIERFKRQRSRAGYRIGDGKRFDFFKYAGWLFGAWKDGRAKTAGLTREEKHRLDEAARLRAKRFSVRNIGAIPAIAEWERRESCRNDLGRFIMTYAGEGKHPFSEDHFRVVKRVENAIFHGGRFVEAVYRGFGKSTISRATAVWALLYGHRRFIALVGANRSRAEENLDAIQGILESDLLASDFPEACFPIQRLEGIHQKCHGQVYETAAGAVEPTRMKWGSELVQLPMTDGAKDASGAFHGNEAAGAVILSCGITSSQIRGMNKRRRDGVELRPDFVILDDPQDDESASSLPQVNKRLTIIRKAILRSAGHSGGMAVVMPCTVIQRNDLVDQLLDPRKNASWQGERIPFVKKWADKHSDLWLDEYARIRSSYGKDDPDDYLRARREATEFYLAHRAEMDAGCVVSWEHCYAPDEDEISAIQHAYNALIDDGEEVFASEFQNQPMVAPSDEGQLTREEVAAKLNRLKRGVLAQDSQTVTAFIDVQGKALYWIVCAWSPDFTGQVVDYGVFPEQHKRQFTLRQVDRSLQTIFPSTGQEGAWRAGLDALTDKLISKEWRRDDGAGLRITRCFIDAGDGNARNVILEACRQSKHAAVVMPSRGQGITAAKIPLSEYKRKPGERLSEFHWRIPIPQGTSVRSIAYDTNYWKTFVRSRWRVAMGDPGSLTLFGERQDVHRMFLDHMVSEYSTRTDGRGRRVDEWAKRPNVSDNHWWDCLVGCAVAASEQGVTLPELGGGSKLKRKPIRLSAIK